MHYGIIGLLYHHSLFFKIIKAICFFFKKKKGKRYTKETPNCLNTASSRSNHIVMDNSTKNKSMC